MWQTLCDAVLRPLKKSRILQQKADLKAHRDAVAQAALRDEQLRDEHQDVPGKHQSPGDPQTDANLWDKDEEKCTAKIYMTSMSPNTGEPESR